MFGDEYRGVFGAFPYAARHSDSWLLRSYVVVAGLLALFVSLALAFALVTLIADTANLQGGSVTLSRAFYGVVGLFVLFPLVAPVLAVARRHRRDGTRTRRHDFAFAVAGYLFVCSLYAALLASTPPARRDPASAAGALEPVVVLLYDAPAVTGLVLPTLAAAALGALWWRTR